MNDEIDFGIPCSLFIIRHSPVMDAQFGKIDRIDADYLRRTPRVDIKEETKINADQNASDEFYSHKAEGSSNFISEIFFQI